MSARAVLVTLVALALPSIVAAQERARTLAPATASLAEEFTRVGMLRELSDGRVLVTDDRENRLLIADFRANVATEVGRKGQGPGEFQRVGRLAGTRADTTLMQDAAVGRRWLVLHGSDVVATLGPSDSVITATGGTLLGADGLGRVLTSSTLPFIEIGPGKRRVQRLHRVVDRATMRADSIASVRGFTIETRVSGPPTAQRNDSFQQVFSVGEQSLLFPDGWVALALQDPYRVDWYAPSGTVVRGAPLPFSAARVDDAEKERWAEGIRRDNPRTPFDRSGVPFADVLPPFPSAALHALPRGALLILRHPSRHAPGTDYDIVDRRGARTGTLKLPVNARIVGSGRESVYVAAMDDDGIERLSRHPWH